MRPGFEKENRRPRDEGGGESVAVGEVKLPWAK